MGWLIALAVIVALSFVPLGISAKFDADGAAVHLIAGVFHIQLVPARKKRKKQPKEARKSEPKQDHKAPKQETKGGSLSDFFPLVDAVLEFLGDLLGRKLRVNLLQARIVLAGDDPCDLAVNYGNSWMALGNLVPLLERLFVIKKRDLKVECDFTADKTLVDARIVLTITLGRLVHLAVRHGVRVLREVMKIMKLRKGGAVQ